ncbi:hypothetical protein Hfx1149_03335 [Haloferax sp. CBA1149]|uniref:Uncharacterized protein n=1 Tax=Haloferax sp. CBA1149 TaxID=2650753 RepID=A0A643JXT1_9EURY|nr:hypothetical protein Hfx1149_03335 [Haloferax sp. CBA1149]
MFPSFEPQSLDSSGDHSQPATPVCGSVTPSVVDEPCTRCESAGDSVYNLFSSRHSTRVSATATTH